MVDKLVCHYNKRMNRSSKIDFSVIIPHRNSIQCLPKLLSTVPATEQVEVLIVDNSPVPITRDDIDSSRAYELFYSAPERGAGGARNVGIEHARGRWLVFVDADDYLTPDAFDTFYSYVDSDAEVLYFCSSSVYIDTGEPADRGNIHNQMVADYVQGRYDEQRLRIYFSTPWPKMVSHELVQRHAIRFDEVVASNDVIFSMLTGYYARSIEVVDKVVYMVTVSKGSLTMRHDTAVVMARYEVALRLNQFLREHGLGSYQRSIMYFIVRSLKHGVKTFFQSLRLLMVYKQNPLIGARNWVKEARIIASRNRKYKKYITH